MKITRSAEHTSCDLSDCARNYCRPHRLLWRDCETVKVVTEGDRDVINGTRQVYELGGCPSCEHEYEMRRYQRLAHEAENRTIAA